MSGPEDEEIRPRRHRLHPLELISMAWATFRREPVRVIVPALVIFALDALQATFYTEVAVDRLGWRSIAGTFVFGASTLGLTFYSGLLERLVGSVERNEPAQPVGKVLRTLPWGRLLVAELILVVLGGVLGAAFLAPGLVIDTLFALVGPLINLLDASVPDALRRSVTVVLPHFFLVFCMIALPVAIEHEIIVLVADLIPHENVFLIFLTTFVLGDICGMALGLLEVTLAERLVRGAHGPGQDVRSGDVELPDSMA